MSRPFSIGGIDHLVLRVADIDASRAFYETVLGCVLEREIESLGLYQLRAGRHLIDLVPLGSTLGGSQAVNQASANQDHFCLEIAPFDEAAIKMFLDAHGIECPDASSRYGASGHGPSVYISDPDGNTVELKGPSQKES